MIFFINGGSTNRIHKPTVVLVPYFKVTNVLIPKEETDYKVLQNHGHSTVSVPRIEGLRRERRSDRRIEFRFEKIVYHLHENYFLISLQIFKFIRPPAFFLNRNDTRLAPGFCLDLF